MYTKSQMLLFVFLCSAPLFTFAQMNMFSQNLSLGSQGSEVLVLQKFLNTDGETRVANVGPGSPGNETNYFGLATKSALIKFQEKYRADVLIPSGLTSGTGFFGEKTRAKMQALMNVSFVNTIPTPVSGNTLATTTQKGSVLVMFPSQYSGAPGTTITISGAGFTATDNTIYFGDAHAVVNAVSWNGQSITFKIPSIPKGKYSLFVKNARGESNKDQFFIVTDGVTTPPHIESVSPANVSRGDTVVIKGSGFTQTGNTLRAGVGFFENVSSPDGSTLSFVIPPNAFSGTTTPRLLKFSISLWVHVVNENGVSNAKNFIFKY